MNEPNLDSYKGVRDFYPNDFAKLKYITKTWQSVLDNFGYSEYSASILEPSELYEAKSSDEILNEQTYNFTDRGDRKVTLRPEMTPTLARLIAKKQKELIFPIRWFSIPNVFRYEKPQRGRLREHWQLNVDILGLDNLNAEIEVIQIASEIMKTFGLKDSDFLIKINDREILNELARELKLDESKKKDFFRLLDKKDKIEDFNEQAEKLIGQPLNQVINENHKIKEIRESLNNLNIQNIVFDPFLVRGFDYYTGIVFEIYDTNPKNMRAIFGGGRYDKLVEKFNAQSVPAVGFGMGDVTISDVLEVRNLLPEYKNETDLYLCITDKKYTDFTNKIAQELRSQNINIMIDYSYKKIKNQIDKAIKRNIQFLICIGEDEFNKNKFIIKDFKNNKSKKIKLNKIAKYISSR